MRSLTSTVLAVAGAAFTVVAVAKLPPLSDEAKAKAAEAAAKTAWNDKVAAFQLCKSQDRTAVAHVQTLKQAGKEAKPATPTPPCADPGPYVSPSVAAAASAPAAATSAPKSAAAPAATPSAPAKKS